MNTTTDLPRIPLAALHLSPLNARKTRSQDIDGLAASIAAHGLLQNLTVTVNSKPGEFEVVAGGRRLAAMQQLQRENKLPEVLRDLGIPCLVIEDNDVAHEASTAENTLREAMHPADQFEAFKRMVDNGKSIVDVAAHFGAPESVVRQRLKLANLAPQFLTMYREETINLEQLQALALTDDHEQQRKAWFSVKESWQRHPHQLRDRITKQEIGPAHVLAKFVGADAYEKAGGPIRRDLFSTAVYFGDKALLEKLALDKLEEIATQERANGWSWVETHLALDYAAVSQYPGTNIQPAHTPPGKVEKARISAIEVESKKLNDEQQSLADDEGSNDRYDEIDERLQELFDERQRLQAGTDTWPDSAKATCGVLVYLDSHRGLEILRGRRRPGQKDKPADVAASKAASGAKGKDTPKKATLSADMVQRLEMHRAAATREHIAARPEAALHLLITSLVLQLIASSSATPLFDLSVGNMHRRAEGLIQSKFGDLAKSPARKALDARLQQWVTDGLPKRGADVLPWVAKLPQQKKLELLALLLAMTLNTNSGQVGAAIAEQLEVDMSKWWTASPDTYFSVVPKALLVDAVADVGGKVAGEKLAPMKKDAAIAEAAKTLNGTGWLPKPLRNAAYVLGKARPAAAKKASAKPAVKKPATKNLPAKKPAAKKAAAKPKRKGT